MSSDARAALHKGLELSPSGMDIYLDLAVLAMVDGDDRRAEAASRRIARDPLSFAGRAATFLNHPLTIGRALLRAATGR